METDFSQLIENQSKLAEKAQNLALLELNEKNSELVETHLGLLFTLLETTEIFYDEDDDGNDEPVGAPPPLPENSSSY